MRVGDAIAFWIEGHYTDRRPISCLTSPARRVEIVEHQMDPASGGIDLFGQVADESHKIGFGPMIGHSDSSSTALGLDGNEQIARSATNVFVVHFDWHAGPIGKGRRESSSSCLLFSSSQTTGSRERNGRAYNSSRSYISCRYSSVSLPTHHISLRHGLMQFFFSSRRIVSRLIGPTSATACAARYSNSSVQRVAPSGGAEQAKAEISASTSAPYWHGLPGRATSRSA